MRIPKSLMGSELAVILYVDEIVDGAGRFAVRGPSSLMIVKTILRRMRENGKLDRSVSVSASEELRSE